MAIINGTSGSEIVNGTTSDDTINGLGGNDTLIGGLGNDTYEFSGNFSPSYDVITESAGGGSDTIHILSDIPASAVRLQGTTSNGLWVIADGYGQVYLGNQLAAPNVEWLQIGSNPPISLTGGLAMAGSTNKRNNLWICF